MKYEWCDECYFYGVEPAMCDECEDGDNFEPAEADDDAFDRLMQLEKPIKFGKVIPIRPITCKVEEEPEQALCYA